MGYTINGVEKDTDDDGYLLEADFSEEAVDAIAAEQGVALTDDHRAIINFLRRKYQEDGHTPNLRNMMKMLEEEQVIADVSSARMFELGLDGVGAGVGRHLDVDRGVELAGDSTLKQRIRASSAATMSSRDLATPENTMRPGSPPAISTRLSSPPETMSKPAPRRASRFSTARFEFAFTA